MVTQIISITSTSDRVGAIATITAAFRNDPVCRWVWPRDEQYDRYFGAFVEAFAGRAFDHGSAYSSPGFGGVALWLPPGVGSDDAALGTIAEESILPGMRGEAYAFFAQQAELHPHEPHWYLPLIGVDPSQQGRGLGASLLRHALEICDRERVPAYLEATTERNRALYERHGFVSTGQAIQAGSSPPMWPMWRDPR